MDREIDNKEVYRNDIGHSKWGSEENALKPLLPVERFFIEQYLPKEGRILEAGTGSGRISFCIEKYGYSYEMDAFDYLEEFIDVANRTKKELNSKVNFEVADAVNLDRYKNDHYDAAIYLQQVISFIPRENIVKAIKELHKKIKPGAIAIISACNWDGRYVNYFLACILQILRFFRREHKSKRELPWLTMGGGPNWKCLQRGQATVYWFQKKELEELFRKTGFEILEVKTSSDFDHTKQKGMLYFVLRKPNI